MIHLIHLHENRIKKVLLPRCYLDNLLFSLYDGLVRFSEYLLLYLFCGPCYPPTKVKAFCYICKSSSLSLSLIQFTFIFHEPSVQLFSSCTLFYKCSCAIFALFFVSLNSSNNRDISKGHLFNFNIVKVFVFFFLHINIFIYVCM